MVDTIQHKALRIALRALNCTPGALLEKEAGVLPLDLRRKQQSLNCWARAKSRHCSNPGNKLVGTGTFIKGKILKRKHVALPFGDAGLDKVHTPTWTLGPIDVDLSLSNKITKTDLPQLIKSEALSLIDNMYAEHLKIYTDGSICPNSGLHMSTSADRGAKEGLLRGAKFVLDLRKPSGRLTLSIVLDRAITRLRMGTTLLPGGAGKYVLGIDPACPRCQEPLTAPHMLLHCPNHKAQRDHFAAALHSHGLVFNLSNVLDPKGAARGPVFSALAKYLLDCQITDKI
ncbi:hypothetical protein DPMN_171504 [Dreissena polymorpha]|uniref:Uncharacterized protein n=1 Tax=Dreissena polymorpha TaxID=45954 RepID=A0A9D4E185_DREPO|nr:hypothetical protein DPMN_171504 [Dreissena polymorpha]